MLNNEDSQQKRVPKIAANHSADIDYRDFIEIFRKCNREAYSFLTTDTKWPSDYPLRFRKNLLVSITKRHHQNSTYKRKGRSKRKS